MYFSVTLFGRDFSRAVFIYFQVILNSWRISFFRTKRALLSEGSGSFVIDLPGFHINNVTEYREVYGEGYYLRIPITTGTIFWWSIGAR